MRRIIVNIYCSMLNSTSPRMSGSEGRPEQAAGSCGPAAEVWRRSSGSGQVDGAVWLPGETARGAPSLVTEPEAAAAVRTIQREMLPLAGGYLQGGVERVVVSEHLVDPLLHLCLGANQLLHDARQTQNLAPEQKRCP